MKISRVLMALVLLLLSVASSSVARGGVIGMTTKASVAPNAFGSGSWAGFAANGMSSLGGSFGNVGDPNTTATAFVIAGQYINPGDVIVSNFDSWKGSAPGAFSPEFGNRLHFPVKIVGDGVTKFRLNDLAYNMTSGDGNVLGFAGNFAGLSYNGTTRSGIDFVDGIEGNGNDILYTSGNGLTPVDKIVYLGVGNAYDASFEPGATNQDKMNSVIDYINSLAPYHISCTYTMFAQDGVTPLAISSASVVVPTPGTCCLGILGALSVLGRRRRAA